MRLGRELQRRRMLLESMQGRSWKVRNDTSCSYYSGTCAALPRYGDASSLPLDIVHVPFPIICSIDITDKIALCIII